MRPLVPQFFTTSKIPVYERMVLKGGQWRKIDLRVRVGYFHHEAFGHSLIDTGYFNAETLRRSRTSPYLAIYRALFKPAIRAEDPISANLARFGITPQAIQTILVTHFHADHIGRLRDFPGANIICSRQSWNSYRSKSRIRNALSGVFDVLLRMTLKHGSASSRTTRRSQHRAGSGAAMIFLETARFWLSICRGMPRGMSDFAFRVCKCLSSTRRIASGWSRRSLKIAHRDFPQA